MDLINWLFGPPSRDQFTSLVIRALRDAGDPRQHRYEKEQFRLVNSGKSEINLRNIYQEHCKLSSAERATHLKQIAHVFYSAANELPELFEEAKKISVLRSGRAPHTRIWLSASVSPGLQYKSTGEITSYCAWVKDCTALLPIMVEVDDGPAICKWDRVARFAKNLLEPVDDLYPIRYRVSQAPTEQQLEKIGRVEL
jgi:hypothetical protein